jgi:hypothetical protein
MNDVDTSVHDKIAGVHHAPGFLLTPFGWAAEPLAALVHAEPSLLTDLFGISRPRMHLIGLGLAHLSPPLPPDVGPLLLRGLAWQVLDRVLGQRPAGLKRALGRLPVAVLQPANYRRLIDLLTDPEAAKALHHADQIDDLAIRVLADLPLPLRRPLAMAVPDWRCRLDGLANGLQFLSSVLSIGQQMRRGCGVSFHQQRT